MENRDKLLKAAARVYAEQGFRGATTRLIAQEAGVNEVTLFRHFGSKDALILEAIQASELRGERLPPLPEAPVDPRHELTAWARAHLHHMHALRSMIRTCLGEVEQLPEVADCASEGPREAFVVLERYLHRLRDHGLISASDAELHTATLLLMGALFAEAMGRDMMPDAYPPSLDQSAAQYVDLLLRALGGRGTPGTEAAPTGASTE